NGSAESVSRLTSGRYSLRRPAMARTTISPDRSRTGKNCIGKKLRPRVWKAWEDSLKNFDRLSSRDRIMASPRPPTGVGLTGTREAFVFTQSPPGRAGGKCVAIVQVKDLIEAGVHFGHRASRWNPKMRPYIYGKRNLIHIIDLRETVRGLLRAYRYLAKVASQGSLVLFVGTKRQAKEAIERESGRSGMPFVSERWLGGTLTNYRTIRDRLKRLQELETLWIAGHENPAKVNLPQYMKTMLNEAGKLE